MGWCWPCDVFKVSYLFADSSKLAYVVCSQHVMDAVTKDTGNMPEFKNNGKYWQNRLSFVCFLRGVKVATDLLLLIYVTISWVFQLIYVDTIDFLAVTFATLGEKTTVMSPEVLIGAGIPCCRWHVLLNFTGASWRMLFFWVTVFLTVLPIILSDWCKMSEILWSLFQERTIQGSATVRHHHLRSFYIR